ncbi:NACHT domain-containing protein [Streptomyces sp. NPDC000594]|uniref:NACHT domain-containing protein n=1 Tax=Streptomyces sp. NPDC000594 TaxID=3154261 RepID=UPI00332383DD
MDVTESEGYEQAYAQALGAQYRRTRVFGLDDLGKRDAEWDLDTAYLSLEATPRGCRDGKPGTTAADAVPQRVETLLATRPRVLLRGDAGAGKTTLIWWLAAHAAARTLDRRLDALNGLVPFVVPLRTLRAQGAGFPGPELLPSVSRLPVGGHAPEGWARSVLASGRALLLVDGLDEIPGEDRADAHQWLSELLTEYPRTRCLATVRPLAVPSDWLRTAGFDEVRLLPMGDEDIRAFVANWHAAARLDDDDHPTLRLLERDLAQQFQTNPTLRDLARTPLLCAVICALHRIREGFLPDTRWALYRSALEMLLGERDKRRRIGTPEGITLSVEEHQQLLQRIAVWLVRGGQTEFSRAQALHQIELALAGMPRVRGQGSPDRVFIHLLNRSGLLQERTDDVFHFSHRTFQDFLAAKEFIEGDQIGELVLHAAEEQWHDVLLLAAGHCSRRELPHLVNGVLRAGAGIRSRGTRRTALYVLAALCAEHAAWLDERTRDRVESALRSVLPPANRDAHRSLARLGPSVVPLLPDSAELHTSELVEVIALLAVIGGPAALEYTVTLAKLRGGEPRVAFHLAGGWGDYPVQEYATRVLATLPVAVPVTVFTKEQLTALRLLPALGDLMVTGEAGSPQPLADALDGREIRALTLAGLPLTDLRALPPTCRIGELTLLGCRRVHDYTALAELRGLHGLHLEDTRISQGALAVIARIPGLRVLILDNPILEEDRLSLAPLRDLPELSVTIRGVPKGQLRGRSGFGGRLTLSP